jgi:hypothetical protein
MSELQEQGVCDIRPFGLLVGMTDTGVPPRNARRPDPVLYALNTGNWARWTAAMLYLVAMGFLSLTMAVLTTSWGQDGLAQMLSPGNAARPATLYMLVAGGYDLGASLLLLSPLLLTKPVRILLLALGSMVMLGALVFAVPSVLLSVLPLVFLYKYHQEVSRTVSDSVTAH